MRLMRPLPSRAQRRRPRSRVKPAPASTSSTSVAVASRSTYGPSGGDLAREHRPDLAEATRARMLGFDERAARGELRVVDELGHAQHRRDARVGGRQQRGPLVARLGLERGAQIGADGVLRGVVHLRGDPLLAADELAEVRPEPRLDRGDRQPAAVGRFVVVVTGVPAGEEPVPRPRNDTGREVLVDRERHQREHAVGRRHVEVRARTGRARGGRARRGSRRPRASRRPRCRPPSRRAPAARRRRARAWWRGTRRPPGS